MNMKKTILALLSLAAVFTVGCTTGGSPFVKRPVIETATVTNTVPVITAVTNTVPGLPPQVVTVTNLVDEIRTVTLTNTVVEISPDWLDGIGTARAVNAIANPTPTAPLVELSLAGLAAALGWIARLKNEKAKGAQELVETLIAGVEKANNPDVKRAIQNEAILRGNSAEIHKAVTQ